MEGGAVYVMVNSSILGMAKVGRTTRPVAERLAELSSATGVPTPFVLAYEEAFADCVEAERAVHAELDRLGWRIVPNREFFRGSPGDIIRIIQAHGAAQRAGAPAGRPASAVASRAATASRLLAEADAHLHGTGTTLQDWAEAARLYQAAASSGSLVALDRLGALYARSQPPSRAGRRRVMRLLKQGARGGNYYCLSTMASLFAQDRHAANFAKAWEQFFACRAAARCEEAEADPGRFVQACCAYMTACLELGLEPGHLDAMAPQAEAIMHTLQSAIEQCTNAPDLRFSLARVLRCSYERLLPPLHAAPVARRDVRSNAPSARPEEPLSGKLALPVA